LAALFANMLIQYRFNSAGEGILFHQVGMIDFQRKSKREQPVSNALKIWTNGLVK